MEWPRRYGEGQEEDRMPLHLTTDGSITELPTDSIDRENTARTVITSRDEWERIGGAWPLKKLVEIWNALPDVTPVAKFTSSAGLCPALPARRGDGARDPKCHGGQRAVSFRRVCASRARGLGRFNVRVNGCTK
jgi:hypothetical protein